MAMPAKKQSKTRSSKRKAHHSLNKINLSVCSNCGQKSLPHTACSNCGQYKGRKVIAK